MHAFKSKNTAAAPLPDSIISSQSFVVIYVSVKSAFIVVFVYNRIPDSLREEFRGTVYLFQPFRTTTKADRRYRLVETT